MELTMEIMFYATQKGNSDVWAFIENLDAAAAKGDKSSKQLLDSIRYCMERVQDGMPHSGPLRHGLSELRPGKYRITYFHWKGDVVCLTVFYKKTNQTPDAEIARAVKRMKDWKIRNP